MATSWVVFKIAQIAPIMAMIASWSVENPKIHCMSFTLESFIHPQADDPGLTANFLLCCRDGRLAWIHDPKLGCSHN